MAKKIKNKKVKPTQAIRYSRVGQVKDPEPAAEKAKESEFAYTITDKAFGEFSVRKSANAWWMDIVKVENLISAFKIDAPIEEATVYAGISIDQWNYFLKTHPEFSKIKDACKQIPFLKARKGMVAKLETDHEFALKYMERKKKAEFSPRTEHTGAEGTPLGQPLSDEEKNKLDEILGRNIGKNKGGR